MSIAPYYLTMPGQVIGRAYFYDKAVTLEEHVRRVDAEHLEKHHERATHIEVSLKEYPDAAEKVYDIRVSAKKFVLPKCAIAWRQTE